MNSVTPKEEIERRIETLRKRLALEDIDGALVVQAVDLYYYSGTRQNGMLWIPVEGPPVLLVRKSLSRAQQESSIGDIRPFPPSREISDVLDGNAWRIGLTLDVLPVQYFNFYRSLLNGREFVDISVLCREIRSVKSAWELQQMRTSGRILAEVFGRIPEFLVAGMRELDFAAEFEYRLRKAGVGGFLRIRGFNQELTGIVAAGENGAAPGCFDGPVTGLGFWTAAPYGPSRDVIKKGTPIMVDYGSFYNGYHTDMTRMFSIGPLDPVIRRAFALSCVIQNWLSEHSIPGSICEELFLKSAKIAGDAGIGDYFMGNAGEAAKFVGHGVGLELDELPLLAPKFRNALIAGQTIALEPKFLFPGKGAVGIENTFVVAENGCEKLTPLPDSIVCL